MHNHSARCRSCGGQWQILGSPASFMAWIADGVGHPIVSLDEAVLHLVCPTCDTAGSMELANG